jgi:O-glycosyl hydrolase
MVLVPILVVLAAQSIPKGTPVFSSDAYLKTPIQGLANTDATQVVVGDSLIVNTKKPTTQTNATQLTVFSQAEVNRGDVLLAQFRMRGKGQLGGARIELLFERSSAPWGKSFSDAYASPADGTSWKQVNVVFKSMASYKSGESMLSFRYATQVQRVELQNVKLLNLGPETSGNSVEKLTEVLAASATFGKATATIRIDQPQQTMLGLGGNFCQPRYGSSEPMDGVGEVVLKNLKVTNGRVGIPLNTWHPKPGVFEPKGQAEASMKAMARLKKLGMPVTASVWEPGRWLIGGQPEEQGGVLPLAKYPQCIEGIVEYFKYAKRNFGVEADYFSFNEPDYGVNFKFTSEGMIEFIRQCGAAFQRAGLKTKFLVGDTANGGNFYDFSKPILADRSIAAYLGPLSFHSWDALHASEVAYGKIKELGKQYKKDVWCMEAGHDPQLWQQDNPWAPWDNALRTVMAYERTVRLTGATSMAYWTYQNNYTVVDPKTLQPYAIMKVLKQLEDVMGQGAQILPLELSSPDLHGLASRKGGLLAGLVIASQGGGEVTISGLPKLKTFRVRVSDRQNNGGAGVVFKKSSSEGQLRFDVTSRSVTTFSQTE